MIRDVIRVEAWKLTHSRVGVIATLAIVAGTVVLIGGITSGIAGGSPELIAKAGPAAVLDWSGLLAGATQIVAAGSILGFGIVLAWMFGREFVEGTITSLFALPASRSKIALAKLVVYALWAVMVSALLTLGVLLLGLICPYGLPNADVCAGLVRLFMLGVFSAGLVVPIAWFVTVTRSVLAAVGGTIALCIAAQAGVLAGAGGWMPVAVPALWALSEGAAVTAAQLTVSLTVSLAFIVLTAAAWERLQLDR